MPSNSAVEVADQLKQLANPAGLARVHVQDDREIAAGMGCKEVGPSLPASPESPADGGLSQ